VDGKGVCLRKTNARGLKLALFGGVGGPKGPLFHESMDSTLASHWNVHESLGKEMHGLLDKTF